mgnify:CR=1 FL=1
MKLPIVIIGFGGHGRVVADALLAGGFHILAATDCAPAQTHNTGMRLEIITDEHLLELYPPASIVLALGIGSIWPVTADSLRRKVVSRFEERGYQFGGVRHPSAIISPYARVALSAQVHAGAVVQVGTQVGDHSIINTKASVDHDCRIGDYCHIGPGATLSGCVELGEGVHVGTGASIIQGVCIGDRAFIAAGATVVSDIAAGAYVRGTPARTFEPKSVRHDL